MGRDRGTGECADESACRAVLLAWTNLAARRGSAGAAGGGSAGGGGGGLCLPLFCREARMGDRKALFIGSGGKRLLLVGRTVAYGDMWQGILMQEVSAFLFFSIMRTAGSSSGEPETVSGT